MGLKVNCWISLDDIAESLLHNDNKIVEDLYASSVIEHCLDLLTRIPETAIVKLSEAAKQEIVRSLARQISRFGGKL